MFKRISEKLVALKPVSWEKMVGTAQVCLLLMFQMMIWMPIDSTTLTKKLAGMTLIIYGALWIIHGIYLLLFENRPTSVSISSGVIITSACCIVGLGIILIVPLTTEMDWVRRMAGIFYSLAFLVWLFVIMKMTPMTRGLLIGIVFCVIASGWVLVCNAIVVINAIVSDMSHVKASWDLAIGFIVSGGAMVGWTLFVMRKTAPTNFKVLVTIFTIFGIIYIGFGIVAAIVITFR